MTPSTIRAERKAERRVCAPSLHRPLAVPYPKDPRQAAADLTKRLGSLASDWGAPSNDALTGLALDMGTLAQTSGIAHVSGTLAASGTITIDTVHPSKTPFTTQAKNCCGIALFGAR
jgi:hypothetical protein